ncbi:MAG: 3-hydroxyacyl-CoA dehydrogenase NAD-binding domain-containing protein [Pseudomonadota bacterium]
MSVRSRRRRVEVKQMSNWHYQIDAQNIAWLHVDMQNSGANILSTEMLEELDHQLLSISQHNPVGLAILSDKKSGFIAGADVKAFAGMTDEHEAAQCMHHAQEIFDKLESLPFPTVALINGFCLGGGLELALACSYRVASDDNDVRIGFPETRLGIFPGFAGTVRATALAGHLNALQLMLTNRNLRGRQAQKIGLVDEVAPQRQFRSAARHLIHNQPHRRKPPLLQRLAGVPLLRSGVTAWLKRQVSKKVSIDHYPAPFALLDHWNVNSGNPQQMALREQQEVARLLTGETAQNLIRVFLLQNRLKAQKGDQAFKPAHVHVVGGGLMGGDIAAWCALKGLTVTLQDTAPETLSRAIGRAHRLFGKRLHDNRRVRDAMDRLIPDHRANGVAAADVVIEAIYEDADAKQALFQKLEPRMKSNAVLATNTSSIPLETLAEKLQDPGRLVGLHFFNPVAKMPLLEIVAMTSTDTAVVDRALAFGKRIAKLPLQVKSRPGFLVNRVLLPYLMEAMQLHREGVAADQIDKAATTFGMPMGPIELADTVGLDICKSVAEKLADTLRITVPPELADMVDAGKLGRKSGEGFYRYEKGRAVKRKSRKPADEDLTERLIGRLLNEAVAVLREGVVADADSVDAGIIFGTGFAPFRGGPMYYIENYGRAEMLEMLRQLEQQHGERFRPDAGWLE